LGEKSQIRYHGAHREQGYSVTLADTGNDSMTGGRLARTHKHNHAHPVLLASRQGGGEGDGGELLAFRKSHRPSCPGTTAPPTSRFGMIEMGEGDRVARFNEKPKTDGWMSAGYFVLERRVFDYISGDDCTFEREPMERLARDGELMGYRHDGFFYAMDT